MTHLVSILESQTLQERLRVRAQIRRQIPSRKSVQEGKPDRLADLLEEAADEIDRLREELKKALPGSSV